MEDNIKILIRNKLNSKSKEELVEALADIFMLAINNSTINAMSSQQCARRGIDTSFAPCEQTINDLLKNYGIH